MSKTAEEGLVITVSGPHGSGRSSQAEYLSQEFGLRYISTGMLFREMAEQRGLSMEEMSKLAEENCDFDIYLDERAKEESAKGGVVIDATLAAWVATNPDLKIYLWAEFDDCVQRIAYREGRPLEEVVRETKIRELSEKDRFQKYYQIDIDDLSVYDVVLNTSLFSLEATSQILRKIVLEYKKSNFCSSDCN
jgi:cytidylate kinase